jgi:hypothetical protein
VAWQDTRNANKDFQPEDVYMASVRLDRAYITPVKSASSVPTGLALAAGLALGLGIAFVAIPRMTPRSGAKAGAVA